MFSCVHNHNTFLLLTFCLSHQLTAYNTTQFNTLVVIRHSHFNYLTSASSTVLYKNHLLELLVWMYCLLPANPVPYVDVVSRKLEGIAGLADICCCAYLHCRAILPLPLSVNVTSVRAYSIMRARVVAQTTLISLCFFLFRFIMTCQCTIQAHFTMLTVSTGCSRLREKCVGIFFVTRATIKLIRHFLILHNASLTEHSNDLVGL